MERGEKYTNWYILETVNGANGESEILCVLIQFCRPVLKGLRSLQEVKITQTYPTTIIIITIMYISILLFLTLS